jgi:hypothetical protein
MDDFDFKARSVDAYEDVVSRQDKSMLVDIKLRSIIPIFDREIFPGDEYMVPCFRQSVTALSLPAK